MGGRRGWYIRTVYDAEKKPDRGLKSKKEAKKGVARRDDTLDEAHVY